LVGEDSVSERVTIDGVPIDRRRESLVWSSGWDDTCTFGGMVVELIVIEDKTWRIRLASPGADRSSRGD
jgi:hypothetical protein